MKFIVEITPIPEENDQVINLLSLHWCSAMIVSRGKITDASKVSRIMVKNENGELIGLATFTINERDGSCELVSINAEEQRKGIGTKMLKAMEKIAIEKGVKRIWLITTNDNYEAAIFYIKNGYRLVNVHQNALDVSRQLKPQIPKIGKYGIPMNDEWEFEKLFDQPPE
jgi:N-acetylglutamate synthase-like GNAT family acetyltransferase